MIVVRHVRVASVAFVCLFALACKLDPPVAEYPVSPPAPPEDTALGPGDIFDVRVFNQAELSSGYQVSSTGYISFPLIGRVLVEGKSVSEVEEEIQRRLADGYIKNPQVSVFIREARSKKVSIFGQVKQPGTFPFTENMSIIEAVTRAGGFSALAKKNAVRVTRLSAGVTQKISVAVEHIGQGKAPPFFLRPGDVIFVPERIF